MWELEQKVEELTKEYMNTSGAVRVSAKDVGLDPRCGFVWVSTDEEWIAVEGSTRLINYYGGFEYIEEYTVIGSYTFYENEFDRVESCLEFYINNFGTEKDQQQGELV
jgi:hypothetical protein|tara:strand:+ start:9653 stop:9976 length:324 start_codon:yes stop_codon:yes gene_type:complete